MRSRGFEVDVYSRDGARRIGSIVVDLGCGELFCDTCGDCIDCYGSDSCYDGGHELGQNPHRFLLYGNDPRYFLRTA